MSEKEDFIERLDAYVKTHNVDYGDLGIVIEEKYSNEQEELEELREEVPDLEDDLEAKDDTIEEMQSEVDAAKEARAEVLAEYVGLDAETLCDRFSVSELGDMLDEHVEGGEAEALEPAPKSGDVEENEGTPVPQNDDLTRDEKMRYGRHLAPGDDLNRLSFDALTADREKFIEEFQARRDAMAAQSTSSPIKQRAVDEYDELLAELEGEE